jgi:hypothetical protein
MKKGSEIYLAKQRCAKFMHVEQVTIKGLPWIYQQRISA